MHDAIKKLMKQKAARKATAIARGIDQNSADFHAFVTLGIEPNPQDTARQWREDPTRQAS
jgi:hypothetical protein